MLNRNVVLLLTKVPAQQSADSHLDGPLVSVVNYSDAESFESGSQSTSMSDVTPVRTTARLPVMLHDTGNGVDKQHDVNVARQHSQDASPTKRRHIAVTGNDSGKSYLQQLRELLDLERQLQVVVVKQDYVEAARIQEACLDLA